MRSIGEMGIEEMEDVAKGRVKGGGEGGDTNGEVGKW